jgi:hypothetical protein
VYAPTAARPPHGTHDVSFVLGGVRARTDRSAIGLPGGVDSPLYAAFVAANDARYRMDLRPGAGGDADTRNTVWVYDTAAFPFYDAEVYHQNHCNFFLSDGMPCAHPIAPTNQAPPRCAEALLVCARACTPRLWRSADPDSYTVELFELKKHKGEFAPTGCPEQSHTSCSSSRWSLLG